MEESKKRAGDSVKHGSPKKQRVSKKNSKAKSKGKDSNKPKRPMSAYFMFLDEFRKELHQKKSKGEQVPTKIGDIAKMAGEKWRNMSDEQKKPFFDRSEKAKKAYEEQVQLNKPARDENKPKKPRTAFFFFLEEFREQKKGTVEDGKKIPSLAGDKWREMDENERKKYNDLHLEAKKEYDEQMKEYIAKNPKKPQEKATKKSKPKVKEVSESEEDEEEEEEEEENDEEDEDDDEDDEDSD